jgi:hypothetical protein
MSMKKENLHQYLIGSVVAFSLLSFTYLNFFSSSAQVSIIPNNLTPTNIEEQKIEKEAEEEAKTAPKIVVITRLFDLAKKFVPSGK